jgi:hypothetical protein
MQRKQTHYIKIIIKHRTYLRIIILQHNNKENSYSKLDFNLFKFQILIIIRMIIIHLIKIMKY